MIIERFFRVIAESISLLALGGDGEFVLSLALFKMMEALEIKDIDTMIRGLEKELKGVEVSEIMVSTPVPDLSAPAEVITITEEDILSPAERGSVERLALSAEKDEVKKHSITPDDISDSVTTVKAEEEQSTVQTFIPSTEPETTETASPKEKGVSTTPKTPVMQEKPLKEEQSPLNAQHSTLNANLFDNLVKKIYDRNYDLGSCFEHNIEFESFADNKLTWNSTAEGDEKKMLIQNWGLINMFVKDLFGYETKIVNIAKKKTDDASPPSTGSGIEHIESSVSNPSKVAEPVEAQTTHNDADSGSMIEEIEMKSSCIAPEAGETEAAKEKDPSTLLEEPMIKAAMELFNPKKVRIKKNV
jgi:DNA polymerase-3 subunit gamma/tau